MTIGTPVRGEQWKLAYAVEATYGTDPSPNGSAGYTGFFGVVQDATLPDVKTDFLPFYGLGVNSNRNWFVAYRGKQQLSGSVSSFMLLDGKILRLAIGDIAHSGTSTPYTHTITEASQLSSISLHTSYVNATGGAVLMRRFHGGKVNSMTLSATEGDFLKCSLDSIMFNSYHHNATTTAPDSFAVTAVPAVSATYSSSFTDVADLATTYPCDQPYLFSYGALSLWGTEFARVRSFRLAVNNACQLKYYVQDGGPTQLPYEIREGKREYTFSCQIDIEDSQIYNELIRQGLDSNDNMDGFQTIITFTRGSNDTITITAPSGTPACGGNSQGCFIKAAPHNINTSDNLTSTNIDILMRSLKIVVVDSYASGTYY